MTSSCHQQKPELQLLATKDVDFPSASAIEFHHNTLYVFGDDAAYLLHLTTDYKVIDSVFFWKRQNGRISKTDKHDIESAFIANSDGKSVLYGIGSMSNDDRKRAFAFDLQNGTFRDTSFFPQGIDLPSIGPLNLEGSCVVNQTTIFVNRANLSNPVNHFLFLNGEKQIRIGKLVLPEHKIVSGVSGLYYLKEKDLLLFTASEEETSSTILDGTIGDSYIGWIQNFSNKINNQEFKPDHFINLGAVNAVFGKQKIESVCVERAEGNRLTLHLAADNDNGTSRFFKLRVEL